MEEKNRREGIGERETRRLCINFEVLRFCFIFRIQLVFRMLRPDNDM